MAPTRIGDVIVPDVWNPWVIQRTAEKSALFASGIVAPVKELMAFVGEGGNTMNMPYWDDLDGDDEVVGANGEALGVSAIGSDQDVAVVLARGKAWGVNELAAQLSGGDPAGAIAELSATYWSRRMQKTLIAILQGIFDSMADEDPAVNIYDISELSGDAGKISAEAMLDAQQLLGDAKDRLTAISTHSKVENALRKQDLIEFVEPSEPGPRLPFYQDKRMVIDDGHPEVAVSGVGTVYDTYLFGPGAIGYAEGTSSKLTMTETDRDALKGEDIFINRRHFCLHPRGIAWNGAASGGGPTNAALATGTNWVRKYDSKNIRIVCLRHRI